MIQGIATGCGEGSLCPDIPVSDVRPRQNGQIMRAVVVDPTVAQRRGRRRHTQALVEIRDVPTPTLPGPGWVLVRPTLSGICVADLELIAGRTAPTPLAAYGAPGAMIPGHEIVGVVAETMGTRHAREGMHVIVEPRLRCHTKGLAECGRCRAGDWHLCENRDRSGPVCGGHGIGMSSLVGGGWSEAVAVHEEMLLPIGDLPDQRAVLAEPTASAIQAAHHWRRDGDRVVVMGSGTRSRLLVATLVRLHPGLDITVIYDSRRDDRTGRMARTRREVASHRHVDFAGEVAAIQRLGAARVWRASPDVLLADAAQHLNARMLRAGDVDLPVLDRGFDAIFDCRATEASVDLNLRLLRAGGTLVMVGRPARQNIDWSLVWDRQLTLTGTAGHGSVNGQPCIGIAREWLLDPGFAVDGVVTHRFPLDDFSRAIATARDGAAVGAVKVVLQGGVAPILTRAAEIEEQNDLDAPLLGAVAARVRSEESVRGA